MNLAQLGNPLNWAPTDTALAYRSNPAESGVQPPDDPLNETTPIGKIEVEGRGETVKSDSSTSPPFVQDEPSKLDWALMYAKIYGAVLPLRPGRKEPLSSLVPNGKDDATRDPETIRRWFSQCSDVNLALVLGSDWLAADFDPRNGGDPSQLDLPETLTQTTASGGTHKLFRRTTSEPLRAHLKGKPGIDFIRDNNYIVVHPSVIAPGQYEHMPQGGVYTWTVAQPADVPEWLIEELKLKANDSAPVDALPMSNLGPATAEVLDRARAYVAAMGDALEGQGGGQKTFQVAQALWGFGLSLEQAWELFCEFNAGHCYPAWSDSDLQRQLVNVYDPSKGYNALPFGFKLTSDAEFSRELKGLLGGVNGSAQAPELERGDHAELACLLQSQITSLEAPAVYADGSIYRYDETTHTFSSLDVHDLGRRVQGYAGRCVTTPKGSRPLKINNNDVNGTISCTRNLLSQPDYFNDAKPGLAFTNGFLEVTADGLHLHPHSPDNKARFAYGFDYNPDTMQPETWLRFLRDVWRDDADVEAKIALLQEFTGAMIFGLGTRFQKAVVLTGDGSNGKGVTFKVIEALMPPGSACSVPPQEMCNEYYRAKIMGKLVNMVAELPDRTIQDTTAFKAFIAGDLLTVRPIREAPFEGRPMAAHLYSCNQLPGTTDTTPAFWRRWLVLPYVRTYTEKEQIADLAEQILEHDRAAIVVWAARGAVRLLKNQAYTVPPSSLRALEAWKGSADVVKLFVDECCELVASATAKKDWAPAKQVYARFRMWCDNEGMPERLSAIQFGDRMRQIKLQKSHAEFGWVFPVKLKQQEAAHSGPFSVPRPYLVSA